MGNYFWLLGETITSVGEWGEPLQTGMLQILGYIFSILTAVSVFYALFLAVKLATATDDAKRKQAKSRVTKTIASIIIILILAGMAFGADYFWNGTTQGTTYTLQSNSFPLSQVNNGTGVTIRLQANSTNATGTITYSIVNSTAPGASIVGNNLKASGAGNVTIRATLNGETVLSEEVIYILPPAPQNPNYDPSASYSTTNPPETGSGVVVNTTAKFWMPVEFGSSYYGNTIIPMVSSGFGPRPAPTKGASKEHVGIDITRIAGVGGYPNHYIYAAALGTVVTVDYTAGNGYHVVVRHDFPDEIIYTHYLHLAETTITVKVGDIVGGKAGDKINGKATIRPYGTAIARMGTTGISTGIHLHFGIFKIVGGIYYYIDPFDSSYTFNWSTKTFSSKQNTGGFFRKG